MRLAFGISYDGSAYEGWQSQLSGRAVQDRFEDAVEAFARVRLRIISAGRTDAGVHAAMQVAHLDTALDRLEQSWLRGVNRHLPSDIAIQWVRQVPDRFHARASAVARRYAYVLLESPVRPSVEGARVGWSFRPLDEAAVREAAAHLVGTHDFTSFRASSCQALSPVKTMRRVEVSRRGAYWRFDFEADAFLHHMIRNVMGCLVAIGHGSHSPGWMAEVLAARDRDAAAPTFSPSGLYFLGPVYDAAWGLPTRTAAYDWLP